MIRCSRIKSLLDKAHQAHKEPLLIIQFQDVEMICEIKSKGENK